MLSNSTKTLMILESKIEKQTLGQLQQHMNIFFHTYNFQTLTSIIPNSQQKASYLTFKPIFFILLIISLIINATQAKETVIVQSLKTRNDKISLRLFDQIQNSIENERYIGSILYECKYFFKNQLTKNNNEKASAIEIELDYGKVSTLFAPSSIGPNTPENILTAKRLDKILNILNGHCLYYSTPTFLYQYCHKEHVRQFDNIYTKYNNQKAEFEDISLGVYNLDEHKQKSVKMGFRQLTQQQRKTTIPIISNFASFYNFLAIDEHDFRFGKFQAEQSESGQFIYSSKSLISGGQDYTDQPIFLKVTCLKQGTEIVNYGMVVDPFTIAYTKKKGKCDKITQVTEFIHNMEYFKDSNALPIRAHDKYLFGNVERICTRNHAWSKNNQDREFSNILTDGSLILVELLSQSNNQMQERVLTVKKVVSPQLIELQAPIGTSFKWNPRISQYFRSNKTFFDQILNISKCQVLFRTPLSIEKRIKAKYFSNNILKLDDQQQFQTGTNFGCIAKIAFGTFSKYIDFNVTISRPLSKNFYQIVKSTNTHILQLGKFYGKQMILQGAQNINCLKKKQNFQITQKENEKLAKKVRLDNKNRFLNFTDGELGNLYVISIKSYGIVKLITRNKQGLKCIYYLTEGQMIKVIQFANGTKQITKQNKYYENLTIPSNNPLKNIIYFRIMKMPNGRLYGGIWKTGDNAFFPRFQLLDEEFIQFERISGSVFLRVFDITKMQSKQSLSTIRYAKRLMDYFEMQERLSADPNDTLFLDKSYQISYLYTSGTYCNLPVNKFRSTKVKLKCGPAWYQITSLLETSPCVYEIQIETRLLCREGFKHIIENDDDLINKGPHDVVINNGVLCYVANKGIYDEVAALPVLGYYE